MTSRALQSGITGLALVVWYTTAAAAQSTGPSHAGFDPNASMEGHYHEGELGAKLLILEQGLRCDCGCGLDLHSCQFQMQCGVSPVWSASIRQALQAGETVEVIEASFVAEFGMQVLMAPPAEGFNILGYAMPAIAIVMAGILAGLVARGGPRAPAPATVEPVSPEDEERIRAALKDLDEAESPDW